MLKDTKLTLVFTMALYNPFRPNALGNVSIRRNLMAPAGKSGESSAELLPMLFPITSIDTNYITLLAVGLFLNTLCADSGLIGMTPFMAYCFKNTPSIIQPTENLDMTMTWNPHILSYSARLCSSS